MKLRNLILFFLTVCGFISASAQSLVLRHRDGTASVVRVTDSLRLRTTDSNIQVASGADIQKYDNDDILSITFRQGKNDVNRDYKTDISDIVAIINNIANGGKTQAVAGNVSDVNGDGKTDISDVVAVINAIAGKDHTALPVVPATDADYLSETGNAFYIYRNDGEFNGFMRGDADSISFSHGAQLVHTPDSTYAIPFSVIDSVSFIVKKPILRDGLFFLNEYHASHITAIDSLTLYFDTATLSDSLPNVGQVVVHGEYIPPFEEGFAGRVKSVSLENNQIKVDCEMICVKDVFKRLILVGNAESVSEEEYAKYRKRRRISGEPWIKYEAYGKTTPLYTLPDIDLSFLGGIISMKSKSPKLQVSYTVYVDEWTYRMSATCRIKHDELTSSYTMKIGDLVKMADDKNLEKKDEEILEAMIRQHNYTNLSNEDWVNSVKNENKKKGSKEKQSKEDADFIKKLWDKLHWSYSVPIYGPIVLDLELGLMPLLKGGLDVSYSETSKARNTLYVETWGNTMMTMANPKAALATGAAHIKGSSNFYKEEPYKQSFKIKGKGSLTLGFEGSAGFSLLHKSLVHANVHFQVGTRFVGDLSLEVNNENADDFGWYDALKETSIKWEPFFTHGVELGISPWSFLTASFDWEHDFDSWWATYLFPHFTKPSLPDYDAQTGKCSHTGFSNQLVLLSVPSKNVIPSNLLTACKIGLRVVDENGNQVRETEERLYSEEDLKFWNEFPLSVKLDGLQEGKKYRCYPVLRYLARKMWKASPSFEFTVPKKMSVTSSTLNVEVGGKQTIYLSGGWGVYRITGGTGVASALFDRSYLTKRRDGECPSDTDFSFDDSSANLNWENADISNTAPKHIGGFSDASFAVNGGSGGGGASAREEVFVNEKDENGIDFPVYGLPVIIEGESAGTEFITLEDLRSGHTQVVTVTVGDGSNSALTLSTTSLDFGNVKAGESKTMEFTVTNNSKESVTFTVGEAQGNFVLSGAGKTYSLMAGGHRTFSVTFSSDLADKDYAGSVTITNALDNSAQRIELVASTKAGVIPSYLSCPDSNHPHAIDLGIGVKFACCNVGASAPWEYGGYYAWGETKEKDYYDWNTYTHCDGSYDTCHDLGSDISGTQYDVAHVKWGKSWHMPSHEQLELLRNNCSSEWTTVNGVYGRIFTGSNGGSIFLPAAGYRWYDFTSSVGSSGEYWSSTQHPDNSDDAYYLYFYSGGVDWHNFDRRYGQSVRPVTE